MASAESAGLGNRPHKGAEFYEVADADLFFGRDAEASELIARILGARLTVLYAPSGAGKTSLLNARISPMLEARGWLPVRVRFDNEPIEAVRFATLRNLLPPLSAERESLGLAMRELGLSRDKTLQELVSSYARIPVASPLRRLLVADRDDIDSVSHPGLLSPFRRVSPYICRLLRGSLSPDAFSDHLGAVALMAREECGKAGLPPALTSVSYATSIGALESLLASPALIEAHDGVLAALYLPLPGLAGFFRNLVSMYGSRRETFQIVLVLDQFEELFARFRDVGARGAGKEQALPDWRLRERFFQELEDLYHSHADAASTSSAPASLPIRYVVALREEYVGRLDRVRLFAPELNESMFRLGLLSKDQVESAILGPARAYRYGYDNEVISSIWTVLAREGVIPPGPLSIVCDQLWEKVIQPGLATVDEAGTAVIDPSGMDRAGLVRPDSSPIDVVISTYFDDFLAGLPEPERVDVLEMLELLITSGGTRNIVEEDLLIKVAFRSAPRRQAVLNKLVGRKLLRCEDRLDGRFVEITHEILIAPMQSRVQTALRDARGLRAAERTLEGIRRGDPPILDSDDFKALDSYETRFDWPSWAVALMLESAVIHGAPGARLAHWARTYERRAWPAPSEVLNARGDESQRYLALEEVRQLTFSATPAPRLKTEQVERILRSLLLAAHHVDRPAIAYWAGILRDTAP